MTLALTTAMATKRRWSLRVREKPLDYPG